MERIKPFYMRGVVDDDYIPARTDPELLTQDETVTENILRLKRISDNGQTTIGRLYLNGEFLCHTLEDTRRFYELSPHDPQYEAKVPGKTCILAGEFELRPRLTGGFFSRYVTRFAHILHRGMIHVTDVFDFIYVLIHCGNTHQDTAGCILVGTKRNDDFIAASSAVYERVYPLIYDAMLDHGMKLIVTDVGEGLT